MTRKSLSMDRYSSMDDVGLSFVFIHFRLSMDLSHSVSKKPLDDAEINSEKWAVKKVLQVFSSCAVVLCIRFFFP